MSERKRQIRLFVGMLIVLVCSGLYAWGGMEMKWLRRFLAPAICGVGCFILSWDWRTLIKTPLLIGASCLGYGADTLSLKIFKRAYVGVAFTL